MQTEGWDRPQDAPARALDVLSAPLPDTMERLSRAPATLVPHPAVARPSSVCAVTPTQFAGDAEVAGRITAAEPARLSGQVPIGEPWQGEALHRLHVGRCPPGRALPHRTGPPGPRGRRLSGRTGRTAGQAATATLSRPSPAGAAGPGAAGAAGAAGVKRRRSSRKRATPAAPEAAR